MYQVRLLVIKAHPSLGLQQREKYWAPVFSSNSMTGNSSPAWPSPKSRPMQKQTDLQWRAMPLVMINAFAKPPSTTCESRFHRKTLKQSTLGESRDSPEEKELIAELASTAIMRRDDKTSSSKQLSPATSTTRCYGCGKLGH